MMPGSAKRRNIMPVINDDELLYAILFAGLPSRVIGQQRCG